MNVNGSPDLDPIEGRKNVRSLLNRACHNTVIEALDTLALALVMHDHKWNAKERRLFDAAIEQLTGP